MHDCLLTDDQRMIRDSARAFARDRLAPSATERDRTKPFPRAEMAELGALGFLGMLVPEEWGGVAADHLSYVIAVEEISAADASIGAMMALHNGLVSTPLRTRGTEAQKERWLRPLATGRMNGAFGLTEPEAGSNAFAIRTRAVKVDGGWRLSGAKQFMSNGKSADIAIVFAAVESDDPKRRITAILVPPGSRATRRCRSKVMVGLGASETCQVVLDQVFVADDQVLGAPGDGYALAMSTLELGRLGIAAQSVGIARAAFDPRPHLCAPAANLRQGHHRASGRRLPACRDADQGRGGPKPSAPCRPPARCGSAVQDRSRNDQALCVRNRRTSRQRGGPGARRIRLPEGLCGRADLPRRPALPRSTKAPAISRR